MNRTRLLYLTSGVLFLAICSILIGVWLHNRTYNAALNLAVAPSDSTITLDGKAVRAGKWRVKSGSHTLDFSRSGFASVSQTVNVSPGQTLFEGQALKPTDPKLADWYSTHPDDQRLAESISGQTFYSNNQQTLSSSPWLKDLPYINLDPYYQISYGDSKKYPNDPTKFALYISANTPAAKQDALKWLTGHGANLNDLEIVYP